MAQPSIDILINATTKGFDQVTQQLQKLVSQLHMLSQTPVVSQLNNMNQQMVQLGQQVGALTSKMAQYTAATDKQTQANNRSVLSALTMQNTIKSLAVDVERMIMLQMRWYAARMLLFTAVGIPVAAISSIASYTIELDKARSEMLRFAATSGSLSGQMVVDADAIVMAMRKASLEIPVAFKDLNQAVQAFVGAGVAPETIVDMTKYIAQLKNAFPEINFEQFAVALTGAFNQFKDSIKGAGTEAEKFRVIMEGMLRAQAIGIIRPEQFTKVLQYMGPISDMVGLTLQQMLAMAVAVTDTGRRAESASRLSAAFLQALAKPEALKNLKSIGIEVDKSKSLASQLDKIAGPLADKLKGGAVPVGTLQFFGGLTSSDRLGVMVTWLQNLEKWYKVTKDLEGATGGLAASSDAMTMSVVKQWQLLQNTFKELGQVLSDLQGGTLNSFLGGLIDLGRGMIVAADGTGNFAFMLERLGAVGYTTMFVFMSLGNIIKVVNSLFGVAGILINGFAAGVLSAVGKISGAIGRLLSASGLSWAKNAGAALQGVEAWALDASVNSKEAMKQGAISIDRMWRESFSTSTSLPKEPSLTQPGKFPKKKGDSDAIIMPDKGGSTRSFLSDQIAALNNYYSKMHQQSVTAAKTEVDILENKHKLGQVSMEKYSAQSIMLLWSAYTKQKVLIDQNESEILGLYDSRAKEIQANSKLSASQKNEALIALEEKKEADLGRLEARRLESERNYVTTSNSLTEKSVQEKRKLFEQMVASTVALANAEAEILSAIGKAQVDMSRGDLELSYDKKRTSATGYYAQQAELINKEADLERTRLLEELANFEAAEKAKRESGRYTVEQLAAMDIELKNKKAEISKAISLNQINRDKQLYDLQRKLREDIDVSVENGAYGEAISKSFDSVIAEFPRQGQQLLSMVKGLSQSMTDTFSDFFFDAMQGKLKTLGDYITSFLQGVARAMSQILAQQTAMSVMSAGKSVFSMLFHEGGTMGEPTGFRLVPAGAFVGAPRFHDGIGPGERAAIIRNDEGVFTKGQMSALGRGLAGASSDDRPISVNIVNQTSQPITSSNAQVKFEPDKIVVTTILRDVQQNGPISRALRSR